MNKPITKKIKAWGIFGKDGEMRRLMPLMKGSNVDSPFAIYPFEGTKWNKEILKVYKCKVLPIEIIVKIK